jgi:hypothetical protein
VFELAAADETGEVVERRHLIAPLGCVSEHIVVATSARGFDRSNPLPSAEVVPNAIGVTD